MIYYLGGLKSAVVKASIVQISSQRLFASLNTYQSTATDRTEKPYNFQKEKHIHPYCKIHPWKCLKTFSESLVKNIIYNKDGLIAINKPYGISKEKPIDGTPSYILPPSCIVNPVPYTLTEAMPLLAGALGIQKLTIVKGAEKFMSGITLLAENVHVEKKVLESMRTHGLHKAYWLVTISKVRQLSGILRVALSKETSPCGNLIKPVVLQKWSKNAEKKQIVKVLNVEFKALSNSTQNLCSLLEVKSSTRKWHALRLFATSVLYCPILGDNLTPSRIQNIQGTTLNVSPFNKASGMPRIHPDLLKLLRLSPSKQDTIPVHIHLREIVLPNYLKKGENLIIRAPLMPPFDWTVEQLKFKLPQNYYEDKFEV